VRFSILKASKGAAFRDERIFPDAHLFRPERYIENPDLAKHVEFAFGSGRVRIYSLL
jgi:cytochrome P450